MTGSRERITRALDLLTKGLLPFVEQELRAVHGDNWMDAAAGSLRDLKNTEAAQGGAIRWDVQALLVVMWDQWHRVFRHVLGPAERSLVAELRDYRNRWAHQHDFNFGDTYRLLDDVSRLLAAVGSPFADWIDREKQEVMRHEVSREAQAAYRRAQVARKRWIDLGVYLVCCLSLVFVILQFFGQFASYLAALFVAIFLLLAHKRISSPPPMFFGPHECDGCGKIIYGERCPYCEYAPESDAFAPNLAEPVRKRTEVVTAE